MPLFTPLQSSALRGEPAPAFDPHFGFQPGFKPGIEPGIEPGREVSPAAGERDDAGVADASFTLAVACSALSSCARALGDDAAARAFDALPARTEDGADLLSDADHRTFLQNDGAHLLLALARLAGNELLDASLRLEHLHDVSLAMDLCVPGCAAALRDAVHTLGCATGGVAGTAARRRADLVRQTLKEVVGATIGLDPGEGARTLRNFESHYVSALECRLGLPSAATLPQDLHFDAGRLSPRIVERARHELRRRVTPAAIARSIAEDALEGLRARLMAIGVDPGRVWPATPVQQKAIDEGIAAIESELGLVGRWTLFNEGPEPGHAGLVGDPTRLAVQVLLNLMDAGAVPVSPIRTRMTWSVAGEVRCLRQLTDGLWWVQVGRDRAFVAGESTSPGVRHLRELGHARQYLLLRDLGPDAREGLARMPIFLDKEELLPQVAPRWLVSGELARVWWRRMGEARCRDWLAEHLVPTLAEDLRFRLMGAADDAGHAWAFARLLPGKEAEAARAWIACDGSRAVAVAARCGDTARLRRWLGLLRIAAPMMNARQRSEALVARDDNGQSALACLMDRADGEAAVRELLEVMLDMHDRRRPLHRTWWPDASTVLSGGPVDDLGAIGVALAHGRSSTLSVYLGILEQARLGGKLADPDVRVLVLGPDDGLGPGHWRGFELAMARNHGDVVRVWTQALIHLARQEVLSGDELNDVLMVSREDRSGVYHEAMRTGATEAAWHYREALRAARIERLLNRGQIARLLCGSTHAPHALSLAAEAGHVKAIEEHLRDELPLLDLPFDWNVDSVERQRWHARGGHAALGAALRHGQADAVRALTERGVELHRAGWRRVLFPAFMGLHRDRPVLHEAVAAGHLRAVKVCVQTLASAVADGAVTPRGLTALLAARAVRGDRLLDMAALALDRAPLAELLAVIVDACRVAELGSAHLLRLLGPASDRPSPMAAALLADRPGAVREIGQCLLRLGGEGRLVPRDLRKLLALRGWSRWPVGKGSRLSPPLADRPRPQAAITAYVAIVAEAVRDGLVDDDRARRWLQPWLAGPRQQASAES